jgi:hypothetical protein
LIDAGVLIASCAQHFKQITIVAARRKSRRAQPPIDVPGHASSPSGHATQAFARPRPLGSKDGPTKVRPARRHSGGQVRCRAHRGKPRDRRSPLSLDTLSVGTRADSSLKVLRRARFFRYVGPARASRVGGDTQAGPPRTRRNGRLLIGARIANWPLTHEPCCPASQLRRC